MKTTTIRLHRATIKRLRENKPTPRTTDDWVINWVLDKLDSRQMKINEQLVGIEERESIIVEQEQELEELREK